MQSPDHENTSAQEPQIRSDTACRTPPRQNSLKDVSQLRGTPRSFGTPVSTGNVTEERAEVLKQMKYGMVSCDNWDDFNLYLPFDVTERNIKEAVTTLTARKDLREVEDSDPESKSESESASEEKKIEVKAFPRDGVLTANETTRYKPLVEICDVLQGLKLDGRMEATCELVQLPENFPKTETDGGNFKVDAYLKLKNSTMPSFDEKSKKKLPIADMAVPARFKRSDIKRLENRAQIFGAANFCMNDDPRRMHVYAITIENCQMNVWYFSRSHSAKSPEFNFADDPRTFIRVMLSFIFATEEELGYDPSIQRRLPPHPTLDNSTLHFVYKLRDKDGDRYFKTEGSIFEDRSRCMTSRATRVWKVVEVSSFEDDDKPLDERVMVLKDMWLDSQSKTERENLDAIFEKLESISQDLKNGKELKVLAEFDNVSKEAVKTCLKAGTWGDYFLTVVCDWKGSSSKAAPVGARPDQTLFDPLPSCPKPASVQYCDPTRSENAREMNAATPIQAPLSRTYSPKQHYRVVFKELCESLHDVKDVQDVATALGGAVRALQLMFLAGWIHRDISTGNIFVCRLHADGSSGAPVRGILADLEYAKRFDPDHSKGCPDRKTGTAFFMAIEIQRQIYMYRPVASMELPPVDSDEEQQGSPPQTDPESSGVIHNFEHDMESVFWVLLWTLLVRFPPARSDPDQAAFSKGLSSIFQNSGSCSPGREKLFTNKQTFETFLQRWLNPALQSMRPSLLKLRTALAVGYYKRGYNFNDRASYALLYKYLWKAIRACGRVELPPSLTTENTQVYPARVKMKRRGSAQDDKNNPKPARVEYNTDATSARMTEPLDPEV